MPTLLAHEPTAQEIAAAVHLEKPARALLRESQTAVEYIEVLAAEGHFADAGRVLARLLSPREAVWWACQCARQALPETPIPGWIEALDGAEKWVREMTDESRRATEPLAHEAGIATAAGCAAMAAFMSGGSIAAPDAPPVTPPPSVVSQFAAGSILVSALTPEPSEAPEKHRRFLKQGIELYRSTLAGT